MRPTLATAGDRCYHLHTLASLETRNEEDNLTTFGPTVPTSRTLIRPIVLSTLSAVLVLLTGCTDHPEDIGRAMTSDQPTTAAALPPAGVQAAPIDHAARTRQAFYASPTQADWMEREHSGDFIPVQVECCGIEGDDLAIAVAMGMQAANNLPNSAPVLVEGADMRQAARVANRLTDAGFSRVILVVR